MICLVSGKQEVLVQKKVDEIIKDNLDEINDFTVSRFDGENTPIQEIISDALTLPFGYDNKVVVVKNPFFLLKKVVKVKFENDYDVFLNFLTTNEKTALIILYTCDELDEKKVLVKKIKDYGVVYKLDDIDKKQWFNIVKLKFAESHIRISDRNIEFFLNRVPLDLGIIDQEINKLGLYSKNIEQIDIEKLVPRPLEEKSYMLLDAFIAKDIKQTLTIFNDLKINGEEPIGIISTLANQLHLQYQVNSLLQGRQSEKEIASTLGIHPYRVKLMTNKSYRFTSPIVLGLLDQLAELDLQIKTGQVERYQALELFLIGNI